MLGPTFLIECDISLLIYVASGLGPLGGRQQKSYKSTKSFPITLIFRTFIPFRPSDVPGGPPRANFLQPHLRLHHRVAERAHQKDQEPAPIDQGGRHHQQDIRQVSDENDSAVQAISQRVILGKQMVTILRVTYLNCNCLPLT